MAATLVRRLLYTGLGIWVFVMAVEEFRLRGHLGAAIGLTVGAVVLLALAATGKGG